MPEVPIPDDWNGTDWQCVQIVWPDSIKWFAILAGLMTMPARGRLWDGRTGSIRDVQVIGREIDARNMPFMQCTGEGPVPIDSETLYRFLESEESEFLMSLCGYNPKAFKIENSALYVRDFCGEWVLIGQFTGTEVLPPPGDVITPPPEFADATACSKATKLAVLTRNIVASGFTHMTTLGSLYIDFPDWLDDVSGDFAGIDFAFTDMLNMYTGIAILQTAGLETETLADIAIDYLKCAWVDLIPEGNEGISKSVYEDMRDACRGATREAFGDTAYFGLGRIMMEVWEFAFFSIGPKDAEKVTYYAQATGLEDCSCPEDQVQYGAATQPTASGWYWSAEDVFDASGIGGFNGTKWPILRIVPHDVYGVAFLFERTSATTLDKFNRVNEANGGLGLSYDLYWFGTASDDFSEDIWIMQCDPTLYTAELSNTLPNSFQGGVSGEYSAIVASPNAVSTETTLGTLNLIATGDESATVTGKIHFRYLFNINSASHL